MISYLLLRGKLRNRLSSISRAFDKNLSDLRLGMFSMDKNVRQLELKLNEMESRIDLMADMLVKTAVTSAVTSENIKTSVSSSKLSPGILTGLRTKGQRQHGRVSDTPIKNGSSPTPIHQLNTVGVIDTAGIAGFSDSSSSDPRSNHHSQNDAPLHQTGGHCNSSSYSSSGDTGGYSSGDSGGACD
jgi:hypothetical protein